jgi:hypothetical protein
MVVLRRLDALLEVRKEIQDEDDFDAQDMKNKIRRIVS